MEIKLPSAGPSLRVKVALRDNVKAEEAEVDLVAEASAALKVEE
jgi:hypothetical protein